MDMLWIIRDVLSRILTSLYFRVSAIQFIVAKSKISKYRSEEAETICQNMLSSYKSDNIWGDGVGIGLDASALIPVGLSTLRDKHNLTFCIVIVWFGLITIICL